MKYAKILLIYNINEENLIFYTFVAVKQQKNVFKFFLSLPYNYSSSSVNVRPAKRDENNKNENKN